MMTRLKEEKYTLIIKAAREVFMKMGLQNARVEDIALEANLSRRTIYRYGNSKEELALMVVSDLFKEWNQIQKEYYKTLKGNGYEKLEGYLSFLVNRLDEMKDHLIYTSEFDNYFGRGRLEKERNDSFSLKLKDFRNLSYFTENLIEKILTEGMADGSLREDIDSHKTALSIGFTLMSISQRLAYNWEVLMEETDSLALEVLETQKRFYLDALKGGEDDT